MLGGRGRTTRIVACSAIRDVPETPSSRPSWRNSGSFGSSRRSFAHHPARACRCSGCDRFHRSVRFHRTSLSETAVALVRSLVDAEPILGQWSCRTRRLARCPPTTSPKRHDRQHGHRRSQSGLWVLLKRGSRLVVSSGLLLRPWALASMRGSRGWLSGRTMTRKRRRTSMTAGEKKRRPR